MSYDGRTEVLSGLTRPTGLEPVPLVDAADIYVKDDNSIKGYQSLSEKIEDIDSAIGSGGNIDERISDAISELDVTDTAITNQFVTAVSETDGKISVTRIQPTAANISGLDTAIDNKIGALDVTDSATENNFVTAVSETNGKVSITRARPTIANVDGLQTELDNLGFMHFSIDTFTATPSLAEIGSTLTSVKFDWTITSPGNKNPYSQNIDGTSIAVDKRTYTMTTSLTATKSYKLTAEYGVGFSRNKSASVTFTNKKYYGASNATTYNSEFINGLSNSELDTDRKGNFTVNATSGNYIFFCIPTSYGTPTFSVGGFTGGFTKVASAVNHTNASGYATTYDVWRSDNAGLGSTTVTVS